MTDPPVDPRTAADPRRPVAPPDYYAPTEYVPITEADPYGYDDPYTVGAQDGAYGQPLPGGAPLLMPDPGLLQGPRKPRVRKVSRVLRAIDAWSVFKISLVFYLAMYAICLVAGVLLWNVAYSTGTIDNLSNFFESFGWKSFEFRGGEIFHNAWILGLFMVVGLTGLNVVLATLFNLIADLVGGVRLTVLEEEVVVRRVDGSGPEGATSPLAPDPTHSRRWRRFRG